MSGIFWAGIILAAGSYFLSVVYHFPLPALSGKWKDISIYSTKKEKRKRT